MMLRLPGPGDVLDPLVRSSRGAEPEVAPERVDAPMEPGGVEKTTFRDMRFILGLVVPAVLLLGLLGWWMMPDEEVEAPPAAPAPTAPPIVENSAKTGILALEEVIKAFLESPSTVELLRQVRDPERIAPKLEAWLAGKAYVAPGFTEIVSSSFDADGESGNLIKAQVRTADYEMREITLVGGQSGFKVDWESWVGWSEMSWDRFQSERPTEGKWFRVSLTQVDYYNFAFKNDLEWASYRLESPDKSVAFYGYVPRTSQLDQEIRPIDKQENVKLLLKLRFPPDQPHGDQVLIEGISGQGWFERTPLETP